MILDFSMQGVKAKTVIKLIAHKFNICEQLARDFVESRSKLKSKSLSHLKKKSKISVSSAVSLQDWEKMALCSKHNYAKEIFTRLLLEESKQETT